MNPPHSIVEFIQTSSEGELLNLIERSSREVEDRRRTPGAIRADAEKVLTRLNNFMESMGFPARFRLDAEPGLFRCA